MPWWIMAAHRAEGAPGRIAVVPVGTLNNTPHVCLLDGHDAPAARPVSRSSDTTSGFELLMLVLTLPRLASIFTDCSVTDPYDCVARQGCGW